MDQIEVTLTDLAKKHPSKPTYQGSYSLTTRSLQDDGEIMTESFGLDNEALKVSTDKIKAILIDEFPPKKSKSILISMKFTSTRLFSHYHAQTDRNK